MNTPIPIDWCSADKNSTAERCNFFVWRGGISYLKSSREPFKQRISSFSSSKGPLLDVHQRRIPEKAPNKNPVHPVREKNNHGNNENVTIKINEAG
jgi:hypothetical protein